MAEDSAARRASFCHTLVARSDEDSSSDGSSSSDLAPLKAELAELLEAVGRHQELENEREEFKPLNTALVKESGLLRCKLETVMFRPVLTQ